MKRVIAAALIAVSLGIAAPAVAKPHPVDRCNPGPGRSDFGHSHHWGRLITRGGRVSYCQSR
jgi:hypothetical protein